MAQRDEPVDGHRTAIVAAWVVTFAIAAIAVVPLLRLATSFDSPSAMSLFEPYILGILRFTLMQATLSAVLSAALAIPVARALAKRQHFPGRELLLKLFAVPLGLPQLIAVLGIISVYGKEGLLNDLLAAAALPLLPAVFGLKGILLAHVFFNFPMAVRFLLARLETVPQENWRLAASLGFRPVDYFRHLEWPNMRLALPGVFSLIFMLCVTSFTIVLTLGGGPQATTLEVAIYQALRFDFDPALAARLAGLQIALCALLLLLLQRFSVSVATPPRLRISVMRPDGDDSHGRLFDALAILLGGLFVAMPIGAVLSDGLRADFGRLLGDQTLWRAAGWSTVIALTAALLATTAAATLAQAIARSDARRASVFRLAGNLVLLIPPLILAAGAFLIVHQNFDPQKSALFAVIIINAMMALPFALPVLEPAFRTSFETHERLAASLGMRGFSRFRLIEWPTLKPSFALAFLATVLISLGEFGVIAFFGSERLITLPLLLYQRIGSYRFNDAAGVALILLLLCLALSLLIERKMLFATRPPA
jgi:thiamine transport system permease protein